MQRVSSGAWARPVAATTNAVVESFFATLKKDLVYRTADRDVTAVRASINLFDNSRRRYSALGYLSPAAFEAAQRATPTHSCPGSVISASTFFRAIPTYDLSYVRDTIARIPGPDYPHLNVLTDMTQAVPILRAAFTPESIDGQTMTEEIVSLIEPLADKH